MQLTGRCGPALRSGAADGSLWHAFRRLWATERKGLPVKDVAAAGGWKDITTLINCYQQPDEETLRAVVEFRRKLSPAAGYVKQGSSPAKQLTQ
jgi:hypothetical protein